MRFSTGVATTTVDVFSFTTKLPNILWQNIGDRVYWTSPRFIRAQTEIRDQYEVWRETSRVNDHVTADKLGGYMYVFIFLFSYGNYITGSFHKCFTAP